MAYRISTDTLTATLTADDAWGHPRTVTVHWIPEDITHADPGRENVAGYRVAAFGDTDHAPVQLVKRPDGFVGLRAVHAELNGQLFTAERVRVEADLAPGRYWVASDSDENGGDQ